MPYVSDDDRQALIDTAQRLQIEPRTLAAVIDYESAFNPKSVGPSGKGYPVRGLIGFDPSNVRKYGMPGATIAEQMPQVEQYLRDRGWKPGEHDPNDLGRLYSIINAGSLDKNGNPRWGARDINGSIADHVRNIQARHYGVADRVLGGPIANNSMDAIDSALGLNEVPEHWANQKAAADKNDIFESAGVTFRSPKDSAGGAQAKPERDMFDDAGITFGKPEAPPAAPPPNAPLGAAGYIDMPGIGGRRYVDAQGKSTEDRTEPILSTPDDRSTWQKIKDYLGGVSERAAASTRAPEIRQSMAENFAQSAKYASEQGSGVLSGEVGGAPANRLGALIGTGVGLGGMALSPLTAATENLVEKPVTALTGNPEAGQRAAFAAGFLPLGEGSLVGRQLAADAPTATNRAVNSLVSAVGPENVPEAIARLRANPQLRLADVSDPVRIRTEGLAASADQPEAQRVVHEAVRQQAREAPAQVNSAYTAAMGPAPDTVKYVDWLKARATEAGRQQIEPALAAAGPVDTGPVLEAIDKMTKPGIQAQVESKLPLSNLQQEALRLKQQLVTPEGETLTDPRRLHFVQADLGRMANQLQQSSVGGERWLGGKLRNLNEKLVDQIDDAAGGNYRPARENFKDAKDIQQAWEDGFDVLKNRSGVPGLQDRPEALRDWMKTATPEEVTAKKLGVRSDIDQKILGVRNQVLAGTNITKIEYNRQKLETLFGKQEAGRLIRSMDDAADMAQTNARIVAGSKTAETEAAKKAMAVQSVGGHVGPTSLVGAALPVAAEVGAHLAGVGPHGLAGGATLLGMGALKAGQLGAQSARRASDLARNVAFGRAALATGQERENAIAALASHPAVIRHLQKRHDVPALTAAPYLNRF